MVQMSILNIISIQICLLKARGEDYLENLVDHTYDMADLLQNKVEERKNFRLGKEIDQSYQNKSKELYLPSKLICKCSFLVLNNFHC